MISLNSANTEIKNIDTVLFDKDGTLIDLHYLWGKITELRVKEIIQHSGAKEELFSKLCMLLGYDISTKKMLPDGITALYSRSKIIDIFRSDLSNMGFSFSKKELEIIFDHVSNKFYKSLPDYIKPIEDAIVFLKKLRKKNIKTGIVTADSVESTNITINHFGWNNLFDIVIGRESSKETKESGEPIKLALRILDSSPKNTVVIGDSPTDSIASNNAKLENVILVSTGQVSTEILKKHSNFVVDNLSQIEIIDY